MARPRAALGLLAATLGVGCAPDAPLVEADPGAPLPGLTAGQLNRFSAGQELFNKPFTAEEGLGPLFNQTRCSSCHDLPSSGGHGAEAVTKFSRFNAERGCDLLEAEGGDLIQASVVPRGFELGLQPEAVPASATALTDLFPPALYGLGLVEAVPSAALQSRVDPDDNDGDGISGRTAGDTVGRFGFKGQHLTLEAFIESAARGEMGLTTPLHPFEETRNGEPVPVELDPADEPEISAADLALLVDYVRMLAPPVVRPVAPEHQSAVRRGERVFEDIGCADCHTPFMTTGAHDIAALDRKRFRVYSDLLLHDLGPDLADICGPGATPSEWKTARLVGLGLRTTYLHSGRAQRLSDAIELHGGEAEASRDAYRALRDEDRERLLRFLRSL